MARSAPLPPGVKAVEWKNATDGTTSTRYRVRLVRTAENFKLDRLCDNLDDAAALLAEARTLDGRKRIDKGRDCLTLRSQKRDIQAHVSAAADDTMRDAVAQATAAEMAELDDAPASRPPQAPTGTPSPADAMREAITQEVAKKMLMAASNGKLTTLGHIVRRYIADNLADIAAPENIGKTRENARTSAKLMIIRLENSMKTPLRYLPLDKIPEQPLVGKVATAYESKNSIMQTLGDWRMIELNAEVGEAYIRQRLTPYKDKKGDHKTRSPITIKRELVDIIKVINDLRDSDRGMWKAIGSENKFAACTSTIKRKGRNKGRSDGTKRWRRISSEEEAILLAYLTTGTIKHRRSAAEIATGKEKTIQRPRNPELALIFRLSIATGLRLSECVLLEWKDIDTKTNTIHLSDEAAKNGARRPMLTREAHAVLADIPRKKNGRLFKYTVQGFKAMWRKIRAECGIEDLVWHDLRRTAISRIWEKIPGAKPVEIAQWFGAQDVDHLRENMLVPIAQAIGNERGYFVDERHARQSVGHADENMTLLYANFWTGRAATPSAPTTYGWNFGGVKLGTNAPSSEAKPAATMPPIAQK